MMPSEAWRSWEDSDSRLTPMGRAGDETRDRNLIGDSYHSFKSFEKIGKNWSVYTPNRKSQRIRMNVSIHQSVLLQSLVKVDSISL